MADIAEPNGAAPLVVAAAIKSETLTKAFLSEFLPLFEKQMSSGTRSGREGWSLVLCSKDDWSCSAAVLAGMRHVCSTGATGKKHNHIMKWFNRLTAHFAKRAGWGIVTKADGARVVFAADSVAPLLEGWDQLVRRFETKVEPAHSKIVGMAKKFAKDLDDDEYRMAQFPTRTFAGRACVGPSHLNLAPTQRSAEFPTRYTERRRPHPPPQPAAQSWHAACSGRGGGGGGAEYLYSCIHPTHTRQAVRGDIPIIPHLTSPTHPTRPPAHITGGGSDSGRAASSHQSGRGCLLAKVSRGTQPVS